MKEYSAVYENWDITIYAENLEQAYEKACLRVVEAYGYYDPSEVFVDEIEEED